MCMSKYGSELEMYKSHSKHLGNLLAMIHGDGGHYQSEHGTRIATEDAIKKNSDLKVRIDDLEYELKCLRRGLSMDAREPHKVMSAEEYEELDLQDWHEVCRNYDGFGGVAIRDY